MATTDYSIPDPAAALAQIAWGQANFIKVGPEPRPQVLALADAHSRACFYDLSICPGVIWSRFALEGRQFSFDHRPCTGILDFYYLTSGCSNWSHHPGDSIYLTPHCWSLHQRSSCAHSALTLPLESASGMSFSLNLKELSLSPTLPFKMQLKLAYQLGIDLKRLQALYQGCHHSHCFAPDASLRAIMHALSATTPIKASQARLTLLNLLHFLCQLDLTALRPLSTSKASKQSIFAAAEDYLQAHLAQDVAIKDAAAHLGISVSALNAYFKRSRAMTAANYLRELRLTKARQLLQTTKGKLSIAAIAAQCGYKNHSKFSAAFKQRFGQSPSDYKA